MHSTLLTTALLAQIANWERLGDGLHGSRNRLELWDWLPYLIGVVAFACISAGVAAYRKYNDLSKPCDDPKKLFRELSLAHGLDRSSQRLLRQLAQLAGLSQPAEVFLSPGVFESHQLPEALRGEEKRLRQLQARLF